MEVSDVHESQRQLTEVILLGVFGDEVPALRHLLDQKLDLLAVCLDCLQALGIINEGKNIAHSSR